MTRTLALLGVLVGVGAGCDDTFVDPFLRDAAPYSMYGAVTADFTARTQRIRVQRIRATVDPPTEADDPAARVDGTLTSLDPASGRLLTWTPRTVVYSDGTVGTVFEQSFQPEPGARIGLVYTDRSGREARGEAVLPPAPVATVFDPVVPASPIDGDATQRVAWTGTRFQPQATVDYTGLDSLLRPQSVRVLYDLVPGEDGGAELTLNLTDDLTRLARLTSVGDDGFIRDLQIRVDVTALSDDTPPAGVIPRDDLGRVFIAGASVGRVFLSPRVKPDAAPDS